MNNLQTPLSAEQKANLEAIGKYHFIFINDRFEALCAPHLPKIC